VDHWLAIVGLFTFPLLLAANAFFVAAEFALVAVRRTRMQEMEAHGYKRAALVLAALEHLDRYIAATQLGITLASLGLGLVVETGVAGALVWLFQAMPAPWDFLARHSVATTIAFCFITFLHVVLGELLPKTIALQTPDRVALRVVVPLGLFELCMRPFIAFMNGTGNWLARLLGFHAVPEAMVHSVQELNLLIEDTEEAGIINADQAKLLQNVFLLTEKEVRDCMVPREKMDALELTTPLSRVLEKVRSCGHTRLPVYEGDLNNIVGVVNTKDLLFLVGLTSVVVLEDALYPAIFLRPDEEVANALRLFKKAKKHMALVRDQEGQVLGMITLEDILEEIIGDIEDEQDAPLPPKALTKLRRFRRAPAAAPRRTDAKPP
jgi:putative hemolysin